LKDVEAEKWSMDDFIVETKNGLIDSIIGALW